LVTWAAVQFLLRYAGERLRVVDMACRCSAPADALTLLAAGPGRLQIAASLWYAVLLALQVAAACYLHRHRRRAVAGFWLMASLLGVAAVALAVAIDSAAQWRGVRPLAATWRSWAARWAWCAGPAPGAAARPRACRRPSRKLQLEQRVREATAEIERNFRQLAELRSSR
jgi:two-component system sensor histidine kinase UhpB